MNVQANERARVPRPLGTVVPQIVSRWAYEIWQCHGCPRGTATQDWLQAETQLEVVGLLRVGRYEKHTSKNP